MTGWLRKSFGAKDAAKATKEAAQTSVDFQEKALEYLKEREAPLAFYQEQGLGGLAQIYGVPQFGAAGAEGGAAGQPFDLMGTLQQNPLYQGIMSSQLAGEEAILRNAAATGGLRSGNVQSNLADFSSELQNQALTTAYQDYVGGLSGLAGLQNPYASQIAQGTAGIGSTLASGITGAAQAKQQGQAAAMGTILGGLDMGMKAYNAFSDIRLKDKVVKIGERNGLPYYSWEWNERAQELGLSGSAEGYMAHEVANYRPDAVSESQGYLMVNEGKLNG